jgi:hypothetical protein
VLFFGEKLWRILYLLASFSIAAIVTFASWRQIKIRIIKNKGKSNNRVDRRDETDQPQLNAISC